MKSVRQDRILGLLAERGTLHVSDAVDVLGCSAVTARRDFAHLSSMNLAERTHGGIKLPRPSAIAPLHVRRVRQLEEKQAIARAFTAMLKPHDVVFVDGGSTTLQIASSLPAFPLRIVTNSLELALCMETQSPSRSTLEIHLTGGTLEPDTGLLVGPGALSSLAQYKAQYAVFSCSGVTPDGVFNTNDQVVASERMMLANAERAILLADHTKIGRHAMRRVCELTQVDLILTDTADSVDHAIDALTQAGAVVREAEASP